MDSLEEIGEVIHEPDPEFVESTNVWEFMQRHGIEDVDELRRRSTTEIEGEPESGLDWFWDVVVDELDVEFDEPYDEVRDDENGPQFTEWYPGGELNAVHNVLDRHAARDAGARNRVACLWEGEPGDVRELTFHDLRRTTDRVAAALRERGIETGDTVGIYMPMVPEVIAALYGCLKLGAIAVPIFSGFGADAVATRLEDAECSVLLTADGFYRRGDHVFLKDTADEAIAEAGCVEHTIVYDRLGASDPEESVDVLWHEDRDEWWADAVESVADEGNATSGSADDPLVETVSVPSNHPAMLLYSSGTTGEPKGIVQTHAGALVQSAKECYFGFDHKPSDRFFWVSDVGWMMGPWTLLGNHHFAGTVFVYEGAPDHPEPDRFWRMIERHELSVFGVSPTAIRALREEGEEWLEGHDRSSLRLLGSTGEPWDPESWRWYHEAVGGGECPILNVSGGTEIFGCFLMPMPTEPLKPCTLGGPGLGMDVDVVDEAGESIVDTGERGYLVARDSCPSTTRSLWDGDERYLAEYWSTWDDLWDHGDFAQCDADGFWFLHGRADDAINVAGRTVGPAEVEGALIDHPDVTRAAAVGVPDETTGQAVVAYAVVEPGVEETEDLREALIDWVGDEFGKPFRPREVLFVDEFPKTQSGKIVRRAIAAAHEGEDPGDRSSIENPEAIEEIEAAR